MNSDTFKLTTKLQEIKRSFKDRGWISISRFSQGEVDSGIFCCIVERRAIKNFLLSKNWGVQPTSEGKPSIITRHKNGKEVTNYEKFADKGIEPFLFKRSFHHLNDSYIDVSEDFVNYFKLHESVQSKQFRTYSFLDELGEQEEVILVTADEVKIKQKFLMQYIAVRKVYFSIGFDFMVMTDGHPDDYGDKLKDEDTVSATHNFNHLIRYVPGLSGKNLQSWIYGKLVIPYDKSLSNKTWLDGDENAAEFIIGFDDSGNENFLRCDSENIPPFLATYFKRTVLDKYYNEPEQYEIDGFTVKSKHFILKIDNNNEDYVAVFLDYLRYLPHKEQLYWKQHNITPQNGISSVYHNTMVLGNWAQQPIVADLLFKSKYKSVSKKWTEKFGWPIFKELSDTDQHIYTALHIPSTDNIKSFCEQILALVKLIIDGLNGSKLIMNLEPVKDEKSIDRLDRFITSKGFSGLEVISFLKSLQDLRSGMIAHRLSSDDRKMARVKTYFNMNGNNYRKVSKEIFIKSIGMLKLLDEIVAADKNELP